MNDTTFEIKRYNFEDNFDNREEQCHVCGKILLRRLDCCRWVYNPKSNYHPVTHFFVCSELCADMYILQHL